MSTNSTTLSSASDTTTTSDTPTTATMSSTNAATSVSDTSSSSSADPTSSVVSSVASVISSDILSSSSTPASTSTSTPDATSSTPPVTSTTIAPTTKAATTIVQTSVVEVSASGAASASSVTVIVTVSESASTVPGTTVAAATHTSSTSSGSASLNTGSSDSSSNSSGLSTGGITAIAVVVPVVVVALLVLAGIFFYRKRKQKKLAEEARRKEVEEYGFNPNNDPTLPAVASESGHEMSEDHSSGYRGWGAATGSNRKMSTTLSGGHTQGQLSDVGSSAYQGQDHNSPTHGSDGHSGDPLVNQRRETMDSDNIGALGHAPTAGAGLAHGMKRGPSNASSTYSAGGAPSETSEGVPPNGLSQSYEAYNPNTGFGYSQHGPYGDGTYGGAADAGMPVVRDVSARRNTRIQQPGNYQQGNSGISQNF